MEPIRIAAVRYLNTLPLIAGLDRVGGVSLETAAPSSIGGLVASGRADIGLVSLVDAARSPVPLAMLPVGGIGCDGPTLTVRVSSRVPPDRISVLHADTESHTSVVLARIVLERTYEIRPEIKPFDAANTGSGGCCPWPDAVLLIGDKVISGSPPGDDHPYRIDLGSAWKDLTGLPFVYAVWMCRADEQDSPLIRSAAAMLDRQRRFNAMRLGGIIRREAAAHHWPEPLARDYCGRLLRFVIGPQQRGAIHQFFMEASCLGHIKPYEPRYASGIEQSPIPAAAPCQSG